jgi:hypothetical protein
VLAEEKVVRIGARLEYSHIMDKRLAFKNYWERGMKFLIIWP